VAERGNAVALLDRAHAPGGGEFKPDLRVGPERIELGGGEVVLGLEQAFNGVHRNLPTGSV
jgi:hypothetical protein